MADLAKSVAEMCDVIEANSGDTTAKDALDYLNDGYRRFLMGIDPAADRPSVHQWSFLQPLAMLTIGGAQDATAATSLDTGKVTVTDPAAGIFDESMVGMELTVTDLAGDSVDVTVDISAVDSATVAWTDGDTAFADKAISVESTGIYALPSDFGGLLSDFVYRYSSAYPTPRIRKASAEAVMQKWRDEGNDPEDAFMWAIAPLPLTAATGQRWYLYLAPTPDTERVLNYRYSILADALTDSTVIYPLGGPVHALTIEAAGLAAAELQAGRVPGVMESRFLSLMAASVEYDRQMFQTMSTEQLTDADAGYD